MSEERMALNEKERDWLQWLHQAKRKQITQKEAALRMQVSERWVRRLLARMKRQKDQVVVHGLRGRPPTGGWGGRPRPKPSPWCAPSTAISGRRWRRSIWGRNTRFR